MRAIFISYRRDDAEGQAGRLFEDLEERFGKASVFMDVTGIEPGRDFRKVIEQQVASCGVLLAIIGKDWLTATDADGHRRLDDPADFVRLETAAALKRDIPVIPVLVRGARMPRAEQLPEVLADLSFRNSVELSHARWASDVQLLINALLPHVDVSPELARTEVGGAERVVPGAAVASGPSTPADGTDVPTEPAADAVRRVLPEGPRSGSAATTGGAGDGGTDRAWWWGGGGLAAVVVAGLGYLAWDRSEPEAGGDRRAAQTPVPSANPATTAGGQVTASAPATEPARPTAAPPVVVAAAPAPLPPVTAPATVPSMAIAPGITPTDSAAANASPRASGSALASGMPASSGVMSAASLPVALPVPTHAAATSERTKPDKAVLERVARPASSSWPETSKPARERAPEAAASRRSAAEPAAADRTATASRTPAVDRYPREQPSAERSASVYPSERASTETAPAPQSAPTATSPAAPVAPATTTTAAVRPAPSTAPSARSLPAETPVAAPPPSPTRVEPPRSSVPVALLGDPAPPETATRTIAIHPTTRYVNVTGGEVVRFTVGDKSFAWNFSGRPSSFDLSVVAPPGMLDRKVTAYVAPNPLYRLPR